MDNAERDWHTLLREVEDVQRDIDFIVMVSLMEDIHIKIIIIIIVDFI